MSAEPPLPRKRARVSSSANVGSQHHSQSTLSTFFAPQPNTDGNRYDDDDDDDHDSTGSNASKRTERKEDTTLEMAKKNEQPMISIDDADAKTTTTTDATSMESIIACAATTATDDAENKNVETNSDNQKKYGHKEEGDHNFEPLIPYEVPVSCDAVWKTYQNCVLVRTATTRRGGATTNNNTNNTSETVVPRTKAAAFDLDGTLLVWRINGWPSRFEHYELWSQKTITILRKLYDEEHFQLVLFSNQGAIRTALVGKKATFMKNLIEWLAHTIDRPLHVVMSANKKMGYHKPDPRMWEICEQFCNSNVEFDIEKSFFVGDSIGGEDDPQVHFFHFVKSLMIFYFVYPH